VSVDHTGRAPAISDGVVDLAEHGGAGWSEVSRLQVDAMPLGEVRAWLRTVVAACGWGAPVERTVLLLVTEVVANAQGHGPAGGRGTVALETRADVLRVAVDDDAAAPPVVRRPPPEAVDGRGMLLVEHLAQEWGTTPRADGGKTVWFTVLLPAT
jgi:anti-sigma regulatory factor (Ser/Thr protein kinase)